MVLLSMFTSLILPLIGGEPPLKIMFFGDSVISGLHNSEASICPFRYDFLRSLKTKGKEVTVVGTNTDKEGSCQKIGEALSLKNNGYQNAGIDELLDFISADLQFLYDPVDYLFTSVGLRDCLDWHEGEDFQLLSQSIRRIMGRLLNLNENAKIYHIPILLPPSASKLSIDCMNFVNQKLRDVYDPAKNHGRIRVVDPLQGKASSDDMFYKVGEQKKTVKVAPPAENLKAESATPKVQAPVSTTPSEIPIPKPKLQTPIAKKEAPAVVAPLVSPPVVAPVAEPAAVTQPEAKKIRRLSQPLVYLPNEKLTKNIAWVLMKDLNWNFRAQTPPPTLEVTKEADYYGYDWCKKKYAEHDCFEYYYGYVWCLKEYSEEECYNYYYGEVEKWGDDDSYKWCLNFYDEEYCSFAYKGNEPDTWEWLSFGYHDCLKRSENDECFEKYYGYAWCVNAYSDGDCYEYYYGGDEWKWNAESNMKWCLNFYTQDECSTRYQSGGTLSLETLVTPGSSNKIIGVLCAAFILIGAWCCYKKMSCFRKSEYSRLDTRYTGGDDEIGFL